MTAEFWVGVGFFLFLSILGFFGVHKTLLKALDARGTRVSDELGEAKRLRFEAEKLLADFETRRAASEQEAAILIEDAKAEAARMSVAAKASVEDFITRRTAQAELKIAQAEISAITEVKSVATNVAIAASHTIIKDQMSGKAGADMFAAGLAEVQANLH